MEGAIAAAAAAAADYLRLGEADAVLGRAAATALALGEAFCGQRLVVRGFEQTLVAAPGWQRLAELPVRAITAPAAGAGIDIDGHGIGWVRSGAAVTVAYSAGLAASWDLLGAPLQQGVVLLAAHLSEHRDGRVEPPAAVAALWRPYRRMRLTAEARS